MGEQIIHQKMQLYDEFYEYEDPVVNKLFMQQFDQMQITTQPRNKGGTVYKKSATIAPGD